MLAAVRSAAVLGIDAYDVTVEVDVALGLPQWIIVGLPASAVKESRERVSAALVNAGFTVPPRRITVNLAPADVKKEGTAFDLPVALGVLVGTGAIPAESVERLAFVGELGLDGALRPVRGALSIARMLSARAASGEPCTLVLPRQNVAEASLVQGLRLGAPGSIGELVAWLKRGAIPTPELPERSVREEDTTDFSDVAGQEGAKRALTVAAAGSHGALRPCTSRPFIPYHPTLASLATTAQHCPPLSPGTTMKYLAGAIVFAALLLSASVGYQGEAQRYEVAHIGEGAVVRLDRQTGETAICRMQYERGESTKLIAPCTGMR